MEEQKVPFCAGQRFLPGMLPRFVPGGLPLYSWKAMSESQLPSIIEVCLECGKGERPCGSLMLAVLIAVLLSQPVRPLCVLGLTRALDSHGG